MTEEYQANADENDAFITGLKHNGLTSSQKPLELHDNADSNPDSLKEIRAQHANLQKVVEVFRSKVNMMMDKQRSEFINAYEAHVVEFHKELQTLRNRVTDIANDSAREDKLRELKESKEFYRKEALLLDVESSNIAKTLRSYTAKIQKLEKERDWLSKRLKKATRKLDGYRQDPSKVIDPTLIQDPSYIFNHLGQKMLSRAKPFSSSSKLTSPSPASTSCKQPEYSWKARLSRDFAVKRDLDRASALPPATSYANSRLRSRVLDVYGSNSITNRSIKTSYPTSSSRVKTCSSPDHHHLPDILPKSIANEAIHPVAALVKARIKRENIRQFIEDCESLTRSLWMKVKHRDLSAIVDESMSVSEHGTESLSQDEQRMQLAAELAVCPETYIVLAELLNESNDAAGGVDDVLYEKTMSEENARVLSNLTSYFDIHYSHPNDGN